MLTHSLTPAARGWFSRTGPDYDVIVSSRVSVRRNLASLPFPHLLNDAGRLKLRQTIEAAFDRLEEPYVLVDGDTLRPQVRAFFAGRGILPVEGGMPVAVTTLDGDVFVGLAGTDHLSLTAVAGGLDLAGALARVRELDAALEESLDYAVSLRLGYLAADIHATGTGMSARVMLHLPALEQTESLGAAAASDSRRMALRRLGDATLPLPSLYSASSEGEFGVREEDTIGELAALAGRLVHYEREAREELTRRHGDQLTEAAHRALGTLSYARRISLEEALDLLGLVRLTRVCGLIDAPDAETVTELLFLVHDNQVSVLVDPPEGDETVDASRATLIRSALGRPDRS